MKLNDNAKRLRYQSIWDQGKLNGVADRTLHWVEAHQLLDVALWQKFVRQFRIHSDSANKGWRGEYWGKMMRGAVMVYKNPPLFIAIQGFASNAA